MKAMRSRELDAVPRPPADTGELLERLEQPSHDRYELLFEALRRRVPVDELNGRTAIHPWFLDQLAEVVEGEAAQGTSLARKKDLGFSDEQAGVSRGGAARRRPSAGVPVCRHLRRRVRGRDSLLLLVLRARHARRPGGGGTSRLTPERRDPGVRPEPDRAGDRIRLLLRPRRDDRARDGPGRGDDQLQPGDGLDRLRHVRPALFRAAHGGGRARGDRRRASRRRDRAVRRPDAPADRGRPAGGGGEAPRHAGRGHRPGRGPRALRRAARPARDRTSALRHRPQRAGGARRRAASRVPPAGTPLLCARRAGDGALLLGSRPRRLCRPRRRRAQR